MRKICVVTGSRAEYGLLYWLLKEIEADDALALRLVVAGMHLSPEFGSTHREIEDDGFTIDEKVEILLSSDTSVGIAKSTALGIMGFAESFSRLSPDIVVLLGDRFEILGAAVAALIARIPTAHIAGGQLTEGAIDDAIRHAVTKMAHLHFTATETYRRRIIQLGEQPERVFTVGSLGLDGIARETLLSREAFEQVTGFRFGRRNLLVTFHPATLEERAPGEQVRDLLAALDRLDDTHLLFTMPNADAGGRSIMAIIEEFVGARPQTAAVFTSLGRKNYLSAMSHVDGVVGNSSSGLIEAPGFRIGTVNIGDRQKGRIRAASVIDCSADTESITAVLETLFSAHFREGLQTVTNPFGDGHAASRIAGILRTFPLEHIVRKTFFDIDFPLDVDSRK